VDSHADDASKGFLQTRPQHWPGAFFSTTSVSLRRSNPPRETGDRIRFNNHVEVGVRMAEAICGRLRFSNEDTEQILALVDNHMKFGAVEGMRASTLKKFVRLPHFEEHLALHRLDCLSSHRNLDSYEFVQRFLEVTPPEQVRPERLLTGMTSRQWGFDPAPYLHRYCEPLRTCNWRGRSRRGRRQKSTFCAILVRRSKVSQAIKHASNRKNAGTRPPEPVLADRNLLNTKALSCLIR